MNSTITALPMPQTSYELPPLSDYVVTEHVTIKAELPKEFLTRWCAEHIVSYDFDRQTNIVWVHCKKPTDVELILNQFDIDRGLTIEFDN